MTAAWDGRARPENRGFRRGWPVVIYAGERSWRWESDLRPMLYETPDCRHCGLSVQVGDDDYDPCLGHIDGAVGACCGHGVHEGWINFQGRLEVLDRRVGCVRIDGPFGVSAALQPAPEMTLIAGLIVSGPDIDPSRQLRDRA